MKHPGNDTGVMKSTIPGIRTRAKKVFQRGCQAANVGIPRRICVGGNCGLFRGGQVKTLSLHQKTHDGTLDRLLNLKTQQQLFLPRTRSAKGSAFQLRVFWGVVALH